MIVRFSKQDIQPNPIEVDYWVDLSENPYGAIIKYYDGRDWEKLGQAAGQTDVTWDDITNKPIFAPVATSGDYNDLTNIPNDNKVITTTSISKIDPTCKLVIATISENSTYSLNGVLSKGKELHTIIKNGSQNDIVITIPTISPYICIGESELTVSAGGYVEINAVSDGTNIYLRGA